MQQIGAEEMKGATEWLHRMLMMKSGLGRGLPPWPNCKHWSTAVAFKLYGLSPICLGSVSQRSLHNEPIFRLLLKVAVKGTQQCDLPNFCGASCPNNKKNTVTKRGGIT